MRYEVVAADLRWQLWALAHPLLESRLDSRHGGEAGESRPTLKRDFD
jgi:hypothetical protein